MKKAIKMTLKDIHVQANFTLSMQPRIKVKICKNKNNKSLYFLNKIIVAS